MGRFIILALLFTTIFSSERLLIVNSLTNSSTLPSRFRKYNELRASASSQFSVEELRAVKMEISSDKVMIIDLREESHGFINNYAVSWYVPKNWPNVGLSLDELILDEKNRLTSASQKQRLSLHKILEKGTGTDFVTMLKIPTTVHYVSCEEDLCHDLNLGYFRIPVTDHVRPSDEMIDRFLTLINTMPKNTHLHFHCSAGAGRATTFMSLYDMIHNAQNTSFNEIIERQFQLGGTNLLQAPTSSRWKYRYNLERQAFLRRFYKYVRENDDGFTTPYSVWSERSKENFFEIQV
ncbi:MAG: protein-tyrosine-phosphatase [Chlamydiales bacterium]